jgi:FHS family L-fucose permease-like MFS transporter
VALGGILLSLGTIFIGGMSLMFPTIYGIALKDLGDDASLGSAGLDMAIVGGALMPPMQATMIDNESLFGAIPLVQTSFFLPLICFVVISIYGYRAYNIYRA